MVGICSSLLYLLYPPFKVKLILVLSKMKQFRFKKTQFCISSYVILTFLIILDWIPLKVKTFQVLRQQQNYSIHSTTTETSSLETKNKKPLKLSIYYETLCPDSLNFLENQLLGILSTGSTFKNTSKSFSELLGLNGFFELEFIPYGKAMTLLEEKTNKRDKYSFICQHGSLECEGNKMHSCVIKKLPFKEMKNPGNLIRFLICSMKYLMYQSQSEIQLAYSDKPNGTSYLVKAALNLCYDELKLKISQSTLHLQTKPFESSIASSASSLTQFSTPSLVYSGNSIKAEIEKCFDSDEGSFLLKINGDLTSGLVPRVNFIPWITFDGIWTNKLMNDGLSDLRKVLCELVVISNLSLVGIKAGKNVGDNRKHSILGYERDVRDLHHELQNPTQQRIGRSPFDQDFYSIEGRTRKQYILLSNPLKEAKDNLLSFPSAPLASTSSFEVPVKGRNKDETRISEKARLTKRKRRVNYPDGRRFIHGGEGTIQSGWRLAGAGSGGSPTGIRYSTSWRSS